MQPVAKANTYLNQSMHVEPSEEEMELAQMCLCEVAEMIYQDDVNKREHGGREIQSENTDGYSVSYATEAEAGKIAVNSLQIKKPHPKIGLYKMVICLLLEYGTVQIV